MMVKWEMQIIEPNGRWWGSAYGETAKELRRNGEGLLIKLEGLEEINTIFKKPRIE